MCNKTTDCPMSFPVCETATHSCVEWVVDADGGAGQPDLTCG